MTLPLPLPQPKKTTPGPDALSPAGVMRDAGRKSALAGVEGHDKQEAALSPANQPGLAGQAAALVPALQPRGGKTSVKCFRESEQLDCVINAIRAEFEMIRSRQENAVEQLRREEALKDPQGVGSAIFKFLSGFVFDALTGHLSTLAKAGLTAKLAKSVPKTAPGMPKLGGGGRGLDPKVAELAAGNISDLLKNTAKGVAIGAFNAVGTKGKPSKDTFFDVQEQAAFDHATAMKLQFDNVGDPFLRSIGSVDVAYAYLGGMQAARKGTVRKQKEETLKAWMRFMAAEQLGTVVGKVKDGHGKKQRGHRVDVAKAAQSPWGIQKGVLRVQCVDYNRMKDPEQWLPSVRSISTFGLNDVLKEYLKGKTVLSAGVPAVVDVKVLSPHGGLARFRLGVTEYGASSPSMLWCDEKGELTLLAMAGVAKSERTLLARQHIGQTVSGEYGRNAKAKHAELWAKHKGKAYQAAVRAAKAVIKTDIASKLS